MRLTIIMSALLIAAVIVIIGCINRIKGAERALEKVEKKLDVLKEAGIETYPSFFSYTDTNPKYYNYNFSDGSAIVLRFIRIERQCVIVRIKTFNGPDPDYNRLLAEELVDKLKEQP